MERLVSSCGDLGPAPEQAAPAGRDGRGTGPGGVALAGIWLGIVAGFIETGGLVAYREAAGLITRHTLRTNWHFAWMIPTSYLVLFGGAGLLLGTLGWASRGRLGFRRAAFVFGFLAVLILTLPIPGIHWLARLVFAIGVSYQLCRWIAPREPAAMRLVRRTLPGLAAALAAVIGWQWLDVSSAEQRALAALPEAQADAPNVVLMVLDTVRADGVFPVGTARNPMPFLTNLASRGVRFDEARSTAPWTIPSHASLFTGLWPHELSLGVGRPLADGHLTLAEYLADRGYATAGFVGNTQNCNAWYGFDQGFAHYEDFYENRTATLLEVLRSSRAGSAFLMSKVGQWAIKSVMNPPRYLYRKTAAMINQDALSWIDRAPGRPFFVFLNYYDAHDPYVPPPGAPRPFSGDPADTTRSVHEKAHDEYHNCLAYLDGELEKLFGELQRRDLPRKTVVIITADHGEGFGEHDLYGHGISLYRQELHVPLLVLLPSDRAAGRRVQAPVSLRDIPATIADLVGSNDDPPFPGRSLARFWSGSPGSAEHAPVLAEVEPSYSLPENLKHAPITRGPMKAVVADGHLYIRNGDGREELYDLSADAWETRNRALDARRDPPLEHFRATLQRLLGEPPSADPDVLSEERTGPTRPDPSGGTAAG